MERPEITRARAKEAIGLVIIAAIVLAILVVRYGHWVSWDVR